jgi:hypothetical protein
VDFSHNVQTSFSHKSPTIKADRKHATDYSRRVSKVVTDNPEVFKDIYQDPNEDYRVEVHREVYLSKDWSLLGTGLPTRFASDLGGCRSAAILKARQNLRSGRVQNGADLAQARQTFQMLAVDARKVLSAWRALKSGNFAYAAQLLGLNPTARGGRDLAALWLELQYGWKPLLSSIHDNAALLRKGFQTSPKEFKAKSTKSTSYDEDIVLADGTRVVWKCHGGTKVQYLSSVRDPGLTALDTFGLINPLEIAWELLPFSFVLDWFVPVGNILESLTATAGLDFVDGFVSDFHQADVTFTRGEAVLHMAYMSFERVWLPGYLLPELYGKANPFSTEHGLNALALLRQLIGNGR